MRLRIRFANGYTECATLEKTPWNGVVLKFDKAVKEDGRIILPQRLFKPEVLAQLEVEAQEPSFDLTKHIGHTARPE